MTKFKVGDKVISRSNIKITKYNHDHSSDQTSLYRDELGRNWNKFGVPFINKVYVVTKVVGNSRIEIAGYPDGTFRTDRFELANLYKNGELKSGGNL